MTVHTAYVNEEMQMLPQRTRRAARRAEQSGFTLIEIMVVVVILGLLVGLVAVNVLSRAEEARQKTAFAQMKSFEEALELYKLDNGTYPASGQGLDTLAKPSRGEPYLRGGSVPLDPWGNKYGYISPGTGGQPYEIISYGSDGEPGGDGDAADIKSTQEINAKKEKQ